MDIWLLIGLLVMTILYCVNNRIWYKHSMKINEDWAEYCIKITEEHYNVIDALTKENQTLKRILKSQEEKK